MKYIPLLLILLLFVCGCDDTSQREVDSGKSYPIHIINIDGCEYIKYVRSNGIALAHKGDCTNSIHIYNK